MGTKLDILKSRINLTTTLPFNQAALSPALKGGACGGYIWSRKMPTGSSPLLYLWHQGKVSNTIVGGNLESFLVYNVTRLLVGSIAHSSRKNAS
jgi:hypothetical protein